MSGNWEVSGVLVDRSDQRGKVGGGWVVRTRWDCGSRRRDGGASPSRPTSSKSTGLGCGSRVSGQTTASGCYSVSDGGRYLYLSQNLPSNFTARRSFPLSASRPRLLRLTDSPRHPSRR